MQDYARMGHQDPSSPVSVPPSLSHTMLQDPGPILLEVWINGIYIMNCLIDGGSGINIMPKFMATTLGVSMRPPALQMEPANNRVMPMVTFMRSTR